MRNLNWEGSGWQWCSLFTINSRMHEVKGFTCKWTGQDVHNWKHIAQRMDRIKKKEIECELHNSQAKCTCISIFLWHGSKCPQQILPPYLYSQFLIFITVMNLTEKFQGILEKVNHWSAHWTAALLAGHDLFRSVECLVHLWPPSWSQAA